MSAKTFRFLFVLIVLSSMLNACSFKLQSPVSIKNGWVNLRWPVQFGEPTEKLSNSLVPESGPPSKNTESDCSGYELVQTVEIGQPGNTITKNHDIGDGAMWSIIQAWDSSDPATTFMAIIQPGWNLDFEAPQIAGTFWQFTGDEESVVCRANEMWNEAGGKAYRLYIGDNSSPSDWSTDFPDNWTMKTWKYSETPIVVEGATWDTVQIRISDKTHTYGSTEGWVYVQLWDGKNSRVVFHPVVAPGYSLKSPFLQGTKWTVTGYGDQKDQVVARFIQMTDKEVDSRDDHPAIYRIFCGPAEQAPENYRTTMITGWTCTAP